MDEAAREQPVIKAMQYSRDDRTLTIWYTAGGIYKYFSVSAYLYRMLRLNHEHPWPVLWKVVRRHPFQRLTAKAAAQHIPPTAYVFDSSSQDKIAT